METKNTNLSRIFFLALAIFFLALTICASGLALAQEEPMMEDELQMDQFCGAHFARAHQHGRRCAVCEEEYLARCEKVDGRIDACPCEFLLDTRDPIVWTKLNGNERVLFMECVRYGYLDLAAEVPPAQQPPINKEAVLAKLDSAIAARRQLVEIEAQLGSNVRPLQAEVEELQDLRAKVEKNIDQVDVPQLMRELERPAVLPEPEVEDTVEGPTLVEGIVTASGGVVIGVGAGAAVGWATSATVLTASSIGGPVGLGVGLVAVGVWWLVAD